MGASSILDSQLQQPTTRVVRFFRRVALNPAKNPLETISACLIIASACYFSLIHLFHFHIPDTSSLMSTSLILDHLGQRWLPRSSFIPQQSTSQAPPPSSTLTTPKKIFLRQFIVDVPKFPVEVPPEGILAKSILTSSLGLHQAILDTRIVLTPTDHADYANTESVSFGFRDLCVKVKVFLYSSF